MKKDKTLIPKGDYCYNNGRSDPCPYWDCDLTKPMQLDGYCHYLESGDWEDEGCSLLWDQVKECGINKYEELAGCDECQLEKPDCQECINDIRGEE